MQMVLLKGVLNISNILASKDGSCTVAIEHIWQCTIVHGVAANTKLHGMKAGSYDMAHDRR